MVGETVRPRVVYGTERILTKSLIKLNSLSLADFWQRPIIALTKHKCGSASMESTNFIQLPGVSFNKLHSIPLF